MSSLYATPEFDEERHEYRLNGRVLPSVSAVIAPLRDLSRVPEDVLDRKGALGRAVHYATALDDLGLLDEASVHDTVRGYLDAWRAFRGVYRTRWQCVEQPMTMLGLGYAGTPDRTGYVNDDASVLEVKSTAQRHRVWGVQLAGYALLLPKPPRRRLAVQLMPTGRFAVEEYEDPNDYRVFSSLLNVRHFVDRCMQDDKPEVFRGN